MSGEVCCREYNLGYPTVRDCFRCGTADQCHLGRCVCGGGRREKSGSFITIDQALEQGKEVFALPGRVSDPLSAGCNRLIAEGAFLGAAPGRYFRHII